MLCEPCHGSGRVIVPATPVRTAQGVIGVVEWIVCPACKGARIVSCCEGTERFAGVAGQPGSESGMGCPR